MKGRKTCSILCAAALALSLTACGNTAATDSDQITEQTLTGQITAIDGSSVTLQLGELSENAQTPPEMPGGSNSDDNSGTPPEMPSGAPSGSSDDQSGQTPPEKPGGDSSSDNAVITVESGCTWNLTGNCTVTSLANNGTINFNGYTITLADGTVLR